MSNSPTPPKPSKYDFLKISPATAHTFFRRITTVWLAHLCLSVGATTIVVALFFTQLDPSSHLFFVLQAISLAAFVLAYAFACAEIRLTRSREHDTVLAYDTWIYTNLAPTKPNTLTGINMEDFTVAMHTDAPLYKGNSSGVVPSAKEQDTGSPVVSLEDESAYIDWALGEPTPGRRLVSLLDTSYTNIMVHMRDLNPDLTTADTTTVARNDILLNLRTGEAVRVYAQFDDEDKPDKHGGFYVQRGLQGYAPARNILRGDIFSVLTDRTVHNDDNPRATNVKE